jgi:ankyrin repeat protein
MDPAGTLLSIAQIIVILTDFAESFDEAPRILSSIRAQIRVVETGVRRIQEWMHFTDPTSKAVIQDSLQEAIATVDDSVGSLKEDLDLILRSGPKMTKLLGRQGSDKWTQTKFAWNEPKLSKHVTDMRECALLLSFTLTVCQLPLGRPAEHAIEELGIGARTLSRAHKSTRDRRQTMLADAKTHAPEEQSADFKVFLEGILDAETTLPDESVSEDSSIECRPQALVDERPTQESVASDFPSFANTAGTKGSSEHQPRTTRSDELFLDNPPAGPDGRPTPPPKVARDVVGAGGRVPETPDDYPEKGTIISTDSTAVSASPHQSNHSTSNIGATELPPRASPLLTQKMLPRKPLVKSTSSNKLEDRSDSIYSSEKIIVTSEESAPLQVVESPVESAEKQVRTDEPQSTGPPPYAAPNLTQASPPPGARSSILPRRATSDQAHTLSAIEKTMSRYMDDSTEDYSTPECPEIIQAVREDQVDRVQELAQQRDNVYVQDQRTGRTALLEAAQQSNRELCRLLLKAGSRINHQDAEGRSALHFAAICNDSVICRMLLAAEASVSLRDKQDRTPLWLAAEIGGYEAVVAILEATPHKKANDPEVLVPFYETVKRGDVATAEAFLVKHVELKSIKEPWKLATYAATSGNTRMLNLVVPQKKTLKTTDPEGLNALHHAAKHGHSAMIERLLDLGIPWKDQTKKRKQTALHLAIANNHSPAALLLINHKTAKLTLPDADDQEPIHLATRTGAFDLVTALLARGAKLKTRSAYGWKPLHLAAAYGHVALMANFITHGIDLDDRLASPSFKPSKKTNDAAQQGYWAEIRWPHEDARALHLAIEFGHVEMAKLLLASGAKADAPDSRRWTPLHYAAFHCQPDIVEVLLASGASADAKTQDGKTPMSLGFREYGLEASHDDLERVQSLLEAARTKLPKSAIAQVFKLGILGTSDKSARERNLVWHTAEMAEALYRGRGDEAGDEEIDGESQSSSSDRRSSSAAAMSSSLVLANSRGFDRRISTLSLRKSLT